MTDDNTESQTTTEQPTTSETSQTSTVTSPVNPMETTSELYQSPLETSQNSWQPTNPGETPSRGVVQKKRDE